jgi:hypothetical protein
MAILNEEEQNKTALRLENLETMHILNGALSECLAGRPMYGMRITGDKRLEGIIPILYESLCFCAISALRKPSKQTIDTIKQYQAEGKWPWE